MIAEDELPDENIFQADTQKQRNRKHFLTSVDKTIPTNCESEKSDSGMEESFLQDSAGISEGSDEENEIVGRKRPKGKRKVIIDDDEDDDDIDDNDKDDKLDADVSTELHSATDNDGNESTAEEEAADPKTFDGDVDMSVDGSQSIASQANVNDRPQKETEQNSGSDDDDDDGPLQLNLNNKDVFHAESSEDEELRLPANDNEKSQSESKEDEDADEGEEEEDNEQNENDEGFDEDELDPELLQKLKKFKGASKSAKEREKYSRKAKPTADKMLEIYSESQRLTRDSRVNLPYHQPEEKTLDDFMARTSKKKQVYGALRRPNDYQRAQIIHEKLSVTPPKLTPSRRSSKKPGPQSSSMEDVASSQATPSSSTDNLQDSGLVSQDLNLSQSQQASQSSTVMLGTSQETNDEEGDLPDLVDKPAKITIALQASAVSPAFDTKGDCVLETEPINKLNSENNSNHSKINGSELGEDEEQSKTVFVEKLEDQLDTIPSLQKDPSRDLFSSQSMQRDSEPPTDCLEIDLNSASASQPGESVVTVVNETPLSTQSTQQSTVSVSFSATPGHAQTDVTAACISASETIVGATQEATEEDVESAASTTDMPQTPRPTTEAPQSDSTMDTNTEIGEAPRSSKKSILDKLQLQGLSIPSAPKLLGTPNDVICLDEPEDQKTTPKTPGVLKLMDRLARHNQRKTPKQAYDVDISIIEKEGSEGQQELKLKSVKYHVQPEEQLIPSDGAPGSERLKLKQLLQIGMKKKREIGRQKRLEMHQLENEEGFEKPEEDQEEEEEEEAEMTDDEEEDSDDNEEELVLGDYGAGSDDDGKDYNPLLDTEAQEEDDDDDEEEAVSDFNEDSNDFHLNFEVSDEEDNEDDDEADNKDDEEDEEELTSLKKKKRGSAAVLSDDEEDDEKDETTVLNERQEKDAPIDEDHATSESLWSNEIMTPLSRHLEDTQPQAQSKFRRQSSCSPDLYATASIAEEYASSPGLNSHNDSHSQSYDFAHSQMLDADGYLKVAQTQRPPKSRISMLAQSPSKDNVGFGSSMSIGQIFGGVTSQVKENSRDDGDDDENMRELMGLCSGKFAKTDEEESLPSSQTRLKRTQSFEARDLFDTADDEDAYDPFRILSQDENAQDFSSLKQKPVLSDSENEEDKENKRLHEVDSDDGSDEEETEDLPKFTGFKDKKRGIRREFLEEEAELSGSEFDSDENLDLAEEDDILEEEEGDREMAGVSESKLRDQVGRLHMKQIQDDDDREIMRYKEMYLQDGDLYTDGRGRRRNFRWKDMDNNSQQDMFTNESDDEQVEEDPEETQWRKDRYERDKFLEESENNGSSEDSQLVKLGQGFLQKKDSFGMSSQEFLAPQKGKPSASDKKKFQLPKKKGSFIERGKETLVKMAKMVKSLGGNVKNSRGFVFQSVDEKETQQEALPLESPMQPPKRKAHTSSQQEQAAKKLKLSQSALEKPTVKRKNSILDLLG